jgi:hypothetical protein
MQTKRNIEELQFSLLNWNRIMSAVRRSNSEYRSKDDKTKLDDLSGVVRQHLEALCRLVGYWSIGRKAMTNIGKVLLQNTGSKVDIICPVCIPYKEFEG